MDNIVFFDGVCTLCNFSVDQLIKLDSMKVLKYSSLQGKAAGELLDPKDIEELKSIIFLKDGKMYKESNAVAQILMTLGGIHKVSGLVVHYTPDFISNFFYRLISKYRYVLFGKKDNCRLPTPDERSMFLD